MSEQTDDWRGLCSVLHDLARKFQNYHVKAAAALDCASEEIFKICRCLDKSEAKVADLEAVKQVLGPHDDRTGDKYGPCATCGISPEIVAERVLSARERGDMALKHVAELEVENTTCKVQLDAAEEIREQLELERDGARTRVTKFEAAEPRPMSEAPANEAVEIPCTMCGRVAVYVPDDLMKYHTIDQRCGPCEFIKSTLVEVCVTHEDPCND